MVDSGNQTPILIAAEGMNELEEKEEQLPSWNRRGGAQRRGGRWIKQLFNQFVHWNQGEPLRPYYLPGLSATPPVPGGELLVLVFRQFTHSLLGS